MGGGGSKDKDPSPVKDSNKSSNEVVKVDLKKKEEEYNYRPMHSAVRWNKMAEVENLLNSSSKALNCIDTVIIDY